MEIWHMSGAGNDFAVADVRGQKPDLSAMALELCKRLGADGFLAVDWADGADFRLHFYNSDGSRGEMCGNGARCVCRFAYDRGIAGSTMTVQTDAGPITAWRVAEDRYRVRLNNPGIVDLHRSGDMAYVELGNPGVPHAVFELKEDIWANAQALKPRFEALRRDPAFPKGANVNAHQWIGENEVRVLTFERGVEDYTLACGTGCGSIATVLWRTGRLPGGSLTAHNRGGTLKLTVSGDPVSSILLEGPTEVVKQYEI
jgi:diaminopimelate epimerase